MPETRPTAIAITTQPRPSSFVHVVTNFFARTGAWAGDTAQEFGAVVSALMGPAVFSAYALAVWALTANLGWTNSFIFSRGPLSNWLVWITIAVLINIAASILRRHTNTEE